MQDVPALTAICAALRELGAQRRAAMRTMQRLQLQQLAIARRSLSFDANAAEKERKKVIAAAGKLVKTIVEGHAGCDTPVSTAGDTTHENPATAIILALQAGIEPIARQRKAFEKEMIAMAQQLPVASFVEKVRGFGFPGLAIIVGEAGNLADYSNPAKLWKRMGLAVIGGRSQRRSTNAEEAILQGYNPERRSSMWTLADSLLKSQIRAVKDGEKDTGERRALGDYGQLYLDRKTYELARPPEETKNNMHAHLKAQRYVEKRLLRDLWRAWRDALTPTAAKEAA